MAQHNDVIHVACPMPLTQGNMQKPIASATVNIGEDGLPAEP